MRTLIHDIRIFDGRTLIASNGAVLVDGDPLADVAILQDASRLSMIMKGGMLHKAPEPVHA